MHFVQHIYSKTYVSNSTRRACDYDFFITFYFIIRNFSLEACESCVNMKCHNFIK